MSQEEQLSEPGDQKNPGSGHDRDHWKNSTFSYPWIDSTHQIRLLRITNASPSSIECAFELQEVSSLPSIPYATLSYCWGAARTDKDIHLIHVQDQPFWVRTNLWSFFQSIHNLDIRLPIYIDAICLNQLDDVERGDQVKLMSEVYSNANHTHVWLGPPLPEQQLNVQSLRKHLSAGQLQSNWTTESFVGLSFILSRIYWRRLWIVQELLLSQDVSLACGKFVFAWQELACLAKLPLSPRLLESPEEVSWWNAWSFTQPRDHSSEQEVEDRLCNGWQAALRLFHHRNEWLSRTAITQHLDSTASPCGFPFYQAMSAFSSQKCGDLRDKVFALIGLLDGEGREMITPDYQISREAVFVQAAAAAIVSCWKDAGGRSTASLKYKTQGSCNDLNATLGLDFEDIESRISQAVKKAQSYIKDRPYSALNTALGNMEIFENGLEYTVQDGVPTDIQPVELDIEPLPANFPLQQSFEAFKSQLTTTEKQDFATTELANLHVTLAAIQNKQRATRTVQNMTRLKAFLKITEDYRKLIDACIGERNVVKFIWGSVKYLLQVTVRRSEAFDGLLAQYERLGESLPALTHIQSLSEDDGHRSEITGALFRNVFEFHRLALDYFKKPAWQEFFSSSWTHLRDRFGKLIEDVQHHKSLVDTQANAQEMEESRQGRVENRTRFSELMEQARQARAEAQESFRRLDANEVERRRAHLFNWLCAPDTESDHDHLQSQRREQPDSGGWLLRNARFRAWFEQQSVSAPLLWITGRPGAGKSVLASLVVDEAKRQEDATTLFFHCKHDDPEKNTFLGMARSILSQLLSCDDTLLMYLFEAATKRGDPTLRTSKFAKEVLNTCLKRVGKTYVIIDGIDECQPIEQQHVAKFWVKYVESSGADPEPSRCALFGQDDATTRPLFCKLPTIRIQGEAHNQDISSYCLAAANDKLKRFHLAPAEKAQIASQTSQRAQGMFLFARLVMKNLEEQVTRADLDAEMAPGVFPEGIEDAYARVIERILVRAPASYRKHARRLLTWTACATRVLKWREIQAAVSIDLETQRVDFQKHQFHADSKELCGALIEQMPNGDVTFAHSTVKPYLVKRGYIKPADDHTSISELCLKYFCLPAFSARCGEDVIRQGILDGTYAFTEYAIISWVTHIEEVLDASPEPIITRKLAEALETFFRLHWRDPRKRSKPTKRITELTNRIAQFPLYEQTKDSMSSMHCLMSTNLSDLDAVQTSDIFMTLARVRTRMEEMVSSPDSVDTLKRFYGGQLYKCPRIYCKWFHEGFATADLRNAHIEKHERAHHCTSAGCVYATFGFPTAKDLAKHVTELHQIEPTEDDFPDETIEPEPQAEADETAMQVEQPTEDTTAPDRPERSEAQRPAAVEPVTQQRREPVEPVRRRRRGPQTFQCEHCPKKFNRAFGLRSHMKTHTTVLEFECGICSKKFARQRDCKRHEEGHTGVRNHVCYETFEDGSTWGCRRRFARKDALERHWRSEAGKNCDDQRKEAERNLEQFRRQRREMPAPDYNIRTTAMVLPSIQTFESLPGIENFDTYASNPGTQSYADFTGMDWTSLPSSGPELPPLGSYGGPAYGEPSSSMGAMAYHDQSMDYMDYGQPSNSRQGRDDGFRDSGYTDDYGRRPG